MGTTSIRNGLLTRAGDLAEDVRGKHKDAVLIVHVRVAFREGHPEAPQDDRQPLWAAVRANNKLVLGTEAAAIYPQLKADAHASSEPQVVKCRISAFSTTQLASILRAHSVTELAWAGVSSSGVILTSTCEAFDMDYPCTVLSDVCGDKADVHEFLCSSVFPKRCKVMTASEWLATL